MLDADVIVVGAGPAGLATAIGLARRGVRALVLERRSEPLDKACGEGVLPSGVRRLAALGVDLAALPAMAFPGICFIDGRLSLSGRFASGPGLGVRRTALSRALLVAAQDAGVEVRLGCAFERWQVEDEGVRVATAEGDLHARLLVGADGLGSRVRAAASLARPRPTRLRRFGFRRHYAIAPWNDFVEVHWGDRAEAYVTPTAPDEIGLALLFRDDVASPSDLLARFPVLAERLEGVATTSGLRGAGPFWQPARARFGERVALVGDAAGYTDAVTGEGIALALACAEVLAETIAVRAPLVHYEWAWRRLSRVHRGLARLLRFASDHPRLRRGVFRGLARMPHGFETLLRFAVDEHTQAASTTTPRPLVAAGPVHTPGYAPDPMPEHAPGSGRVASEMR